MPPKRKANKPTEEAVDPGLKKKQRIDKEEFDGEEGDDVDVKSTENIKPKRGVRAAEQKPAPATESKSRAKGKAPAAKSTKKDVVKSNLDDEESDSSVESKKDAPVKSTKKIEKKASAPETKRKARGGNEGPSEKFSKLDEEVSPFIEADEDNEVPVAKSSKAAPKGKGRGAKATQSKAKVAKKNEDVAEVVPEEELELSPVEEEPKKKPAATKGSKKMIPEVIEDEEIEPHDSSEDEFQKKTTTTKVTKKNAKKHQEEEEVEPEDVSSDESKKKAPVSKRGKRNVKKDVIHKDESEPEDDAASGDSKKTAPAEKASKKEVIQEEQSEPEDVSSDDSKKKAVVTKGVKKNVKKEAETATASRDRSAKTTDKKEKLNPTETSYETLDFSNNKKNAAGDVHNLRIASWNIGGIKSWVKKDCLKYVLQEKPDIFCIQETKCNAENYPAEIEEIEGYKFYWHSSSKNGYAGASLWSRIEPIEVQYGIGNEEQDEDGRCITAEFEKYYVLSVYVPNAGRKLVNMAKRLEWNKLFKNFVKELDAKKPVIICGDLNVAHNEIDLANPKTNTKSAGFTPEEREGFTELLNEGFIDTYRNFNPDATGAYTFWTYMSKSRSKNVGWRLDYFVTSNRLKDNLCDSLIRSSVLGSDHCPIVLFLNI